MPSFVGPACLPVSVPERLAMAVAVGLCASHHCSKKFKFLGCKIGSLTDSKMPCGELGDQSP